MVVSFLLSMYFMTTKPTEGVERYVRHFLISPFLQFRENRNLRPAKLFGRNTHEMNVENSEISVRIV